MPFTIFGCLGSLWPCLCVYTHVLLNIDLSSYTHTHTHIPAAGAAAQEDESRKKRAGSNTKRMSLELVYKSGGLEHKIVLSPSTSPPRKHATEWLRALKKVGLGKSEVKDKLVYNF